MKCVCGRELEYGKSLCCECEALVLSQKDCDRYLKLKERSYEKNNSGKPHQRKNNY